MPAGPEGRGGALCGGQSARLIGDKATSSAALIIIKLMLTSGFHRVVFFFFCLSCAACRILQDLSSWIRD